MEPFWLGGLWVLGSGKSWLYVRVGGQESGVSQDGSG